MVISETTFSNLFSKLLYLDFKFDWSKVIFFWGFNYNMSSLVQVMAWHQTGAKPLPDPMMTQFIDVD